MKKSIYLDIPRTIDDAATLAPAPLESCTDELRRRPWRPPDYQTENAALVTLSNVLADSPREVLHDSRRHHFLKSAIADQPA